MPTITLTEFQPQTLAADALLVETAERIWRDYGQFIHVEPPSFRTENRWVLTAQGYVGFLPINQTLTFALLPKVPLNSLFHMLEVVYDLPDLQLPDQLASSASLADFFQHLTYQLAQGILVRCRRGLHKEYETRVRWQPTVSGSVDVAQSLRKPWAADMLCRSNEFTADIAENQLFRWALYSILRSGLCNEETQPIVRRAYRAVGSAASLRSFGVQDSHFHYSRLTRDYGPLHALCRLFLAHLGPTHQPGEQETPAFTINMAHLFERFVARWLQQNLPTDRRLQVQERYPFGANSRLYFDMDLVLYDEKSGRASAVLDTKYKTVDSSPSAADIQQVLAYAHVKGTPEALLVYPERLPKPIDETINGVRIRTTAFDLASDVATAGATFSAMIDDSVS